MSNTNRQQTVSAHRGILASADIAPSPDITKLIVGPFKVSERPRLSTRSKNVDPKGSLVCRTARLDDALPLDCFGLLTISILNSF